MNKFLIFATILLSTAINASEVGRYQLIGDGKYLLDTFLLDTVTGKTWRQKCVAKESKANPKSDCAIFAWAPEDIIGLNAADDKKIGKFIEDWQTAHP